MRQYAGLITHRGRKTLVASVIGFSLATCASCAMQGQVQRQTVEYNTAAAQMANELTLLNIVRAEEGMPLYYTSISRLTGSVQLTASGGFNAQLKAPSPVDTTSATTATAKTAGTTTTTANGTTTTAIASTPPGGPDVHSGSGTSNTITTAPTNSVVTTVTDLASQAVTSGGNIYMPSVGGQIVTGPSFDINILDTQLFYQGVLGEIPFSTVELYIDQDWDNQLLMRLLIDRLEFTLKNPVPNYQHPVGFLAAVMHNVPSGIDDDGKDMAWNFAHEVSCYRLEGKVDKKPDKPIAPLSRVTNGMDNKQRGLRIQDLATFDGTKLDLDRPIPEDPAGDHKVQIMRPSTEKRVAHLQPKRCADPLRISDDPTKSFPAEEFALTPATSPDTQYAGASYLYVKGDDGEDVRIPTDIRIIFRSPEGVLRFLGQYLLDSERDPTHTYRLRPDTEHAYRRNPQAMAACLDEQLAPDDPSRICPDYADRLFSVHTGHGPAVLATELLGKRYYIADDDYRTSNMQILALVEQLVNLQKSATDRPTTIPVLVVP